MFIYKFKLQVSEVFILPRSYFCRYCTLYFYFKENCDGYSV